MIRINPEVVNWLVRGGMVAGVVLGVRAFNGSPEPIASNVLTRLSPIETPQANQSGAPKLVLSPSLTPEGNFPSPVALKKLGPIPTFVPAVSLARTEVINVRMSDEEVAARGRDFNPQDESHNIANCLKPSFQLAQADQSLVLRVLSWLPLFPTSAEASSAFKTPEDVVSCLKNETLLVDFVKTNKQVDLSKIKPENVKGEFKYKELAEKLAELKLLSLGQGKAMFGSTVEMTFKDGNVIRSRPATMLDDEKEVERRRKNGEKMIFWTGEAYEVVVVDGQLLVLRQDCANLLLQVAVPSPKSEATVIPVSEASTATPRTADTATNTPVVTTSTATETPVIVTPTNTPENPTNTPTKPNTPTSIPTNTHTLPTYTPGATATLVATRTPGGPTPTAIGTRTESTATVIATITVRPNTPTSIPTNTHTLPTYTPGATATLVATRTTVAGAATPTPLRASGAMTATRVSGGGIPSPTSIRPSG